MSEDVKLASKIMVLAIAISALLLFIGIGLLLLVHLCLVGRAFRRGYFGTNFGSTAERSSARSTSMSKDVLDKLPCFDYLARSPADCCAVCLENFKMGEKCRLLPFCRHSFHAKCVDLWLMKNTICPICRATVDSSRAGFVSGDQENGHSSDMVTSELGRDSNVATATDSNAV